MLVSVLGLDRYPISYTALVLPISVARWSSFPTVEDTPVNQLPILKTSITVFIFGLSGGCSYSF